MNVEFPWESVSLSQVEPISGSPIYITEEMVSNPIAKMKSGKAAGRSGIVVEMIRSAGKGVVSSTTQQANCIVYESIIPEVWKLSIIFSLYKVKGDSLSRGSYRSLKLLDQLMKIIVRVIETMIRSHIEIQFDDIQFRFMQGRCITEAIFILRQLQEKHIVKHRRFYFAFADLEKTFDRVPRKVLWSAMRKAGVEELVIRVV